MTHSIVSFAGLLVAIAAGLPGAALAQPDERSRISQERSAVEAAFSAQEKACYRRFAVNDCLEEARSRRRDALSELRRQEVALNDVERRRRAADRLQDLRERATERAGSREGGTPALAPPPAGGRSAEAPPGARVAPATPALSAPLPAPKRAPVGDPVGASPGARPATGIGSAASRSSRPARTTQATPPKAERRGASVDAEQRRRHQKRLEEAHARKERAAQKAAARTERAQPLPVP